MHSSCIRSFADPSHNSTLALSLNFAPFPCHASALGTLFSAVLALTLDANPKAASYDYLEHCALDVRKRKKSTEREIKKRAGEETQTRKDKRYKRITERNKAEKNAKRKRRENKAELYNDK